MFITCSIILSPYGPTFSNIDIKMFGNGKLLLESWSSIKYTALPYPLLV
jgi:hypothetical protein